MTIREFMRKNHLKLSWLQEVLSCSPAKAFQISARQIHDLKAVDYAAIDKATNGAVTLKECLPEEKTVTVNG